MADETDLSQFEIDNFIYVKDGALPNDKCAEIITGFEDFSGSFVTETSVSQGKDQFKNGRFGRDDMQIYIPQSLNWLLPDIQKCIFEGLEEYSSVVQSVAQSVFVSCVAKVQKTPINGGYSVWHTEQAAGFSSSRALVWAIYLNDVGIGGETEFLYQQKRVEPKRGRLTIWPAGITHPHRGNPPYSNEKYIVTGWFEYPAVIPEDQHGGR